MISYIVSVYDRAASLEACLASLALQEGEKQILVCANHLDGGPLVACGLVAARHGLTITTTGRLGARSCYESANMIAPRAVGDWLCFPSDDSLYVQEFARIMLETAERTRADLVYCDCLYRQDKQAGGWPAYTVLDVQPRIGQIDKTCFIVKQELFDGFPEHTRDWRDGALIEHLVSKGVRHAKAPGVLVLHQ